MRSLNELKDVGMFVGKILSLALNLPPSLTYTDTDTYGAHDPTLAALLATLFNVFGHEIYGRSSIKSIKSIKPSAGCPIQYSFSLLRLPLFWQQVGH